MKYITRFFFILDLFISLFINILIVSNLKAATFGSNINQYFNCSHEKNKKKKIEAVIEGNMLYFMRSNFFEAKYDSFQIEPSKRTQDGVTQRFDGENNNNLTISGIYLNRNKFSSINIIIKDKSYQSSSFLGKKFKSMTYLYCNIPK